MMNITPPMTDTSRRLVLFLLTVLTVAGPAILLHGCSTESSPAAPQAISYQVNITGTAVLSSLEQLDSVKVSLSAPAMIDSTGMDGRFYFTFKEFRADGVYDVGVTLTRRTCRDTTVTATYSRTTNTVHLGLIVMGLKP